MAEQESRKGGGGKLSRTETVTVRLDPKLRYLADLAARTHRRTLSSYIEWTIKKALDSEMVRPAGTSSLVATDHSIGNEAEYLWDVDDADRFAKLALRYPHLLSHEEQVRWKLIRENGYLWRGNYSHGPRNEWAWRVDEDTFQFARLREFWDAFCKVADTGNGHESLPKWSVTAGYGEPPSSPPSPPGRPAPAPRPAPPPAPRAPTGFDNMDDDIKF